MSCAPVFVPVPPVTDASLATLAVPASALVREDDLTGVYLAAEGEARLRWVRLGRSFSDSVEVLSGLRDGDRVVVTAASARR